MYNLNLDVNFVNIPQIFTITTVQQSLTGLTWLTDNTDRTLDFQYKYVSNVVAKTHIHVKKTQPTTIEKKISHKYGKTQSYNLHIQTRTQYLHVSRITSITQIRAI